MTPPHMANLYRALARPYEAIADVFKKGDVNRLKAEIDVGRSIWQMVGDIQSFMIRYLFMEYKLILLFLLGQ